MSDDLSGFDPPDPSKLGPPPAAMSGEAAPDSPIDRAIAAMMERPGVVMAGETRDAHGRPALLVGVKTTRDMARIPSTADGFPVVVQVIGEVVPH